MLRSLSASAVVLAALAVPCAAQMPPMPDHPELREGWLAWFDGDYPTALRTYLRALEGPEASRLADDVAALTGEIHPVVTVAADGHDLAMAPDGVRAAFDVDWGGRSLTHLVDPVTGEVVDTVTTEGWALGSGGRLAYFRTAPSPARDAALERAAEAGARRDFAARNAARDEAFRHEVLSRSLWVRDGGASSRVDLGAYAPVSAMGSPDGGDWWVVGTPRDGAGGTVLLRMGTTGPDVVPTGPGDVTDVVPVPGGRFVVAAVTGSGGVGGAGRGTVDDGSGLVIVDRTGGGRTPLPGGESPVVSADGSRLAWLRREGAATELRTLALDAGTLAAASGADAGRLVVRSDVPLADPALAPGGDRIAWRAMPHDDWEVFVGSADGSGDVVQVTWEIQHDLFPTWLDDGHVLAAKGEGRHRRSFVYDVDAGTHVALFHNNTVRTIAPEYEWAATPDGARVLIVAERDGDTVSPERGVYLVDRTVTVGLDAVRARVRTALAAEEDLRLRGRAAFAPVDDRVRAVVADVSVARIYEYARDVYRFGSKFITQPGNARAIEYYTEALRSFGYEPELQWFEPRPGVRTANIIVRIPGTVDPELVYVASSHFDSVERGPGADDDSSGGTALLEVARVLKDHPMPATVELAFFTGEEAGLLGSREYVRRAVEEGKRIVGALNNDMIGWANDPRLDNTIRYSNPGIRDIQHAAALRYGGLITYDALYYKNTDAHAYYEVYGDIVGGIGSHPVLGNPHYHQASDRLNTIDQRLVAAVAKTTAATLMLLAASPSRLGDLVVEGETARWTPARETGVTGYEVRWETADGWETTEVPEARARLPRRTPEGGVHVRAIRDDGTRGWDWARAGG